MLHPDNNNEFINPYQPVTHTYLPMPEESDVSANLSAQPTQEDVPQQNETPVEKPPVPKSASRLRTGAIIALTLMLAIILGVGLTAGWELGRNGMGNSVPASPKVQSSVQGQTTIPTISANSIESLRVAAIAKVKPAIVQINVTTSQGQQLGSGVIIDQRGYIVTNKHVVQGEQTLEVVMFDGSKLAAQLVGSAANDDLAVIKIQAPANIVVARLGDSSKLSVGEEVLAIGNPLGITQTATNGIVSALNRTITESAGTVIANAIQTDAAINPGNSGGALVDLKGDLVGIPTLTAINSESNTPANGVGFAIPSNRVGVVVPQIIQSGNIVQAN